MLTLPLLTKLSLTKPILSRSNPKNMIPRIRGSGGIVFSYRVVRISINSLEHSSISSEGIYSKRPW